ncbi:tRNA (adenosine(37)-N6)-threonylcarbamoyltransferase complex dimerization subunit type 1 TsaB [Kocuria sp. CNJ-770]|uniref:tRNA (adenosine(37)-N6)-threonylcarbamoyltransferase complex dimerization subunit type 1 TsaB n=1 Tax=Kocuria sp. CNJ-770 TaxID=1904964 RepID=UPI00095FF2AA|nr:tRNA (adenosine(37)-N6)-threonylcarbamoyltransferase complex dimerization subunit type 1 TsaB [Kocuria sp. CNJ-770]OLT08477.1 tRNA (adenosine(37)-N6)-threonylcarbamoyltransferase complex dimerization subunit type 1 TsaB [Kocuria sp. CNJ-770]
MLLLCLDSSAVASAALVTGAGEIAGSFVSPDTRSHAEVLAPAVRDLLDGHGLTGAWLDGVLVGTGPGPFTGLRAGIATARALAFAWDLPLHGLMSLEALAQDAAEHARAAGHEEFLVLTDARRKEVYWARYALDPDGPRRVAGPGVAAAEQLPALPAYGRGAGIWAERLALPVPAFAGAQPTASSLGLAALRLRARGEGPGPDTTPLYLRESDAKVPGPRKKALA